MDKEQRITGYGKACRAVPLAAALICLSYNVLTMILCSLTPDDPLGLTSHVSLYALAGCGFSLIGAGGILLGNEFTIQYFAQFILADAFISVVARMFLEEFIVETLYSADVCGSAFSNSRWSKEIWSRSQDAVGDLSSIRQIFDTPGTCDVTLVVVHALAVAVMILTSVVQVSLALSVQRFAKQLEAERRQASVGDVERQDDDYTMPEKSVMLP